MPGGGGTTLAGGWRQEAPEAEVAPRGFSVAAGTRVGDMEAGGAGKVRLVGQGSMWLQVRGPPIDPHHMA